MTDLDAVFAGILQAVLLGEMEYQLPMHGNGNLWGGGVLPLEGVKLCDASNVVLTRSPRGVIENQEEVDLNQDLRAMRLCDVQR